MDTFIPTVRTFVDMFSLFLNPNFCGMENTRKNEQGMKGMKISLSTYDTRMGKNTQINSLISSLFIWVKGRAKLSESFFF